MTVLLVVIDPVAEEHVGLRRVQEIPPSADVDIHVALFVEGGIMASQGSNMVTSLADQRAWLDKLVQPLIDNGYCLTPWVRHFSKLHESILDLSEEIGVDLILKPYRQHGFVGRNLKIPTDAQLVRHTSIPVLMIGDQPTVVNRPVVAAIDLGRTDKKHRRVNQRVVEQTRLLEMVLNSDATFVYTQTKKGCQNPLAQVSQYDIKSSELSCIEGAPEVDLPAFAQSLQAGITVVGTVSRAGASGMVNGNTAEAILEATSNDVLVVPSA